MKLSIEEKIKFWLSILAKGILILFLGIKAFDYIFTNDTKKDVKEGTSDLEISGAGKSANQEKEPSNYELPPKTNQPKVSKNRLNDFINISHIIKYRGKPIENAHFIVDGCQTCKSTITSSDGIAEVKVPKDLFEDGLTHQFLVFRADSLIYQKSMRFLNLQLDEY